MEANPFFLIEQPNITIIPGLQKLDSRTPDKFMASIWSPGGHSISIKKNTTIGYIKEMEYIEKSQIDQQENIKEVSKISQDKLPPMLEKSAFTFHHNFYPKIKVVLEDATISDKTQARLQELKQDCNDIVSQHSSDIGLAHLEEMTVKTGPDLPPVASKPYPLALKHHTFVKEEIGNLLEAGLIKRSMSPYAAPIIVDPRKSKPGVSLAETKRLVIDY